MTTHVLYVWQMWKNTLEASFLMYGLFGNVYVKYCRVVSLCR